MGELLFNHCYQGDCRSVLQTLPDESVQLCVSSPPYWRQRDYGAAGQLGLEQTPEEYIDALTKIFREVRRILKPDGSLFLNVGDKWASGGNGGGGSFMENRAEAWAHAKNAKGWRSPPRGYKDKDLVGIPWMTAFALRADGWYLRQCNIWAKPNGMPESVTDRSTAAHEYVFHLTKSADYFYDNDTARTPAVPSSETRLAFERLRDPETSALSGAARKGPPMPDKKRRSDKQRGHSRRHSGFNDRWDQMPMAEQQANGANLRSVWWIAPAQYGEGHYAVMPDLLAEICIVCGSRPGDVVLDPFMGAGTTAHVAQRLGRQWVGIELNPAYIELQRPRTAQAAMAL